MQKISLSVQEPRSLSLQAMLISGPTFGQTGTGAMSGERCMAALPSLRQNLSSLCAMTERPQASQHLRATVILRKRLPLSTERQSSSSPQASSLYSVCLCQLLSIETPVSVISSVTSGTIVMAACM